MKKIILSVAIVAVLFWSFGEVFAEGKGKSSDGRERRTEWSYKRRHIRRTDANEPSGQGRQVRRGKLAPSQEQREMRRRERQKVREVKRREIERGKAGEAVSKSGEGKAVEKEAEEGKGHQQQLKAIESQVAHEEAKHHKRLARLNRIRELAGGENEVKVVERVDSLLEKEQKRYERKQQRMEEKKQKVTQVIEKDLSEKMEKAVKKGIDIRKAKAKRRAK